MAKKVKDPGLGYSSSSNAQRIINADGSSNVVHANRRFGADDLYAFFIELPWWQFFAFILIGYSLLNILFAFVYVFIGIEQITPSKGNFLDDLLNGFFFSAQTLTTVGYGGIAPKGIAANVIAAFEAMIGLLSFSFITGLLYGRFSKAKASIRFSENLILRDFKEGRALMFRLMNRRKTVMIEPEITVTLSLSEKKMNGKYKRQFFELKLERNKIMYLPTVWTVVHEIDEKSPLHKYSNKEISELNGVLYVLMQYHEESFGQKVYQITSYNFSSLEVDVKYTSSFYFDEEGNTVLDHSKLSEISKMN
ncbi:ion transporter [Tenacibaculum discolor]|uniref:Ion channel n=1 Tax=Tenacibaculum discolor TaxID=361581 RepID=A0A2G1BSF4_9FLAO|nr:MULTISPECIES: ion channel [Tenacibaculum]MDP2542835.1 ion channel [Tenacibaculum discolor]NVK10199.1 ion transporter [Tenacibaculum sp.]PHN97001.1 ion transporter [Tenacibaculum discolor]PHO01108.1 ion transporter [Rhodobacteraceae bacterium 4F10]